MDEEEKKEKEKGLQYRNETQDDEHEKNIMTNSGSNAGHSLLRESTAVMSDGVTKTGKFGGMLASIACPSSSLTSTLALMFIIRTVIRKEAFASWWKDVVEHMGFLELDLVSSQSTALDVE